MRTTFETLVIKTSAPRLKGKLLINVLSSDGSGDSLKKPVPDEPLAQFEFFIGELMHTKSNINVCQKKAQ